MRRALFICLIALLSHAGRADPRESAIVAIMQLSEAPNYSWVATVSDDARTYDVIGKTIRGGYTHVRMPLINSVRRRFGRSVTDTQVDLIFRGNVDCVIDTDDGWKTPSELPMLAWNAPERFRRTARPATGHGVSHGTHTISPRGHGSSRDAARPYSNLQLAISHPHEELGVIVGSHKEFNVEGDIVTGTLTDLGAQLLLVRDGQKSIEPIAAAGTFKIWLQDGRVTKYRVTLEGVLNIHVPSGRRQIEVHQDTQTILKDIGTTTFEVPPQARAKLGS